VHFQLTSDQQALQEGLRSFCTGRVSLEQLREIETQGGFDRALWSEVAEMGAFSLRLPESQGGVGLGCADAVLVFEELGRSLVPGPLAWTQLAAPLVEGAATGATVVGGLDLFTGEERPYLIEHGERLDVLLVLRRDGVYRIEPGKLDATPVEVPLDPFTPLCHVAELPEGERIADARAAAQLRLEGAALVSGQLLGIAETTQELATDYAKRREQFDRPIGAFQAIKHLLADMFVRQELTRAAVWAAGATLDDPGVGDVERAVASAKIVSAESAQKNARSCIQVHGGMGYTWEIPAHYYLKRSFVLASQFGTPEQYADRLGALADSGPRADG
jgi:alkylation response protein AidB-like acyl-CoA dehydrogenase